MWKLLNKFEAISQDTLSDRNLIDLNDIGYIIYHGTDLDWLHVVINLLASAKIVIAFWNLNICNFFLIESMETNYKKNTLEIYDPLSWYLNNREQFDTVPTNKQAKKRLIVRIDMHIMDQHWITKKDKSFLSHAYLD